MNVLFISQCSKKALKESRRILDQFAERRGDCTWQTAITQQGLDTLRKLLKKTARKNTAVACHWIRGKNHSELLWIVGDIKKFNSQGAVPTNITTRDVLRVQDEDDWLSAEEIRLFSALASLFHDIGKANLVFQDKLKGSLAIADPLRHEWVSLRLFEALVLDGKTTTTDEEWLTRLTTLVDNPTYDWIQYLKKDKDYKKENIADPFRHLPPLAKLIGWLIVTHHRLPKNAECSEINSLHRLPDSISKYWCGIREADKKDFERCWKIKLDSLYKNKNWHVKVSNVAKRILSRAGLLKNATLWLANPYVVHLSRLTLMLADHYYSSLIYKGLCEDDEIYANTNRKTKELNQPLSDHLVGVATNSEKIALALPKLKTHLPYIQHKGFKQRSKNIAFQWQDKAYDLAYGIQKQAQQKGFFGVNMASTGCGKTLGNGRIMYALSEPSRGARFTIALGLRVLTLQTGEAYRQHLGLNSEDLAVLTGGMAVKTLFNYQKSMNDSEEDLYGAESSAEDLLPDQSHVSFEGSLPEGPLSEWLSKKKGEAQLLNAPIVACTIDHLIPATESTRGGNQILPMLRLLTSDLILDEPDDFSMEDLPALTRLVYWVGLLGSRVLLSSATLPPALVQGLFEAYAQGRKIYQENRGIPGLSLDICCSWFDEFSSVSSNHADKESFLCSHQNFVSKRLEKLKTLPVKRRAKIIPIVQSNDNNNHYDEFVESLYPYLYHLHNDHKNVDAKTNKTISFGLIRMANIAPLFEVTKTLMQQEVFPDYHLYLCCYHSKHSLIVRSAIESRLDKLLNRKKSELIFTDKKIRNILDNSNKKHHIFIVLASPVAEVGRDHDYDWAIVEPSSMRSIIQLAGRVRRHRNEGCLQPNLYLLDENIKALKKKEIAYCRPGFENEQFILKKHKLSDILLSEQLEPLNAGPRIKAREQLDAEGNLVDLEHKRLQALMWGDDAGQDVPVYKWWTTLAHLSAELQYYQLFRRSNLKELTFGIFLDEYDNEIFKQRQKDGVWETNEQTERFEKLSLEENSSISFWGAEDEYIVLINKLATELEMEIEECVKRFGVVELEDNVHGWIYHPWLGFTEHKLGKN